MDFNSKSVAFIYFYIIAFIFVREPIHKLAGYIILTIVYIISGIAVAYVYSKYNNIITHIITNPFYMKGLIFAVFTIVFVTLFSLIYIIDAYYAQASKLKSFDLKLNQRYKNLLATFENAFLVGNVTFACMLLALASGFINVTIIYIGILVPFVCVWFQLASAIRFSKIKND